MPQQVQGITIADNGDGTVVIWIGPFGYTRPLASLFDRTLDEEQIRQNVRLAFLIGGYAQPNSSEFLTQVNNGANGMEGKAGKVYITSIDLEDEANQVYRLWFDTRRNGPGQFGVPVTLQFLQGDDLDREIILLNLVSFLRVAGHASLNEAALNAIRAQRFWY